MNARISFLTDEIFAIDGIADSHQPKTGGARRDRTDDLLLAKQALSQLSYGPIRYQEPVANNQKLESSDC